MDNNTQKSPIISSEEELRQKLLSFIKYIGINHANTPVSVSINFENKFGDKRFARIETDGRFDLVDIVRAIESSAEDKLDSVLKQLRTFNEAKPESDDNG